MSVTIIDDMRLAIIASWPAYLTKITEWLTRSHMYDQGFNT